MMHKYWCTYFPPWSSAVGCIQFRMELFWTGATGSSFIDGGSGLLTDETGGGAVMNMYNYTMRITESPQENIT